MRRYSEVVFAVNRALSRAIPRNDPPIGLARPRAISTRSRRDYAGISQKNPFAKSDSDFELRFRSIAPCRRVAAKRPPGRFRAPTTEPYIYRGEAYGITEAFRNGPHWLNATEIQNYHMVGLGGPEIAIGVETFEITLAFIMGAPLLNSSVNPPVVFAVKRCLLARYQAIDHSICMGARGPCRGAAFGITVEFGRGCPIY